MTPLSRIFGPTPRVRLLEALIRLSAVDFTRDEAREEAGLKQPSTNRALENLERDGFIRVVSAVRPRTYRVNEENPLFRVVTVVNAFADNLDQVNEPSRLVERETSSAIRTIGRLAGQRRELTDGTLSGRIALNATTPRVFATVDGETQAGDGTGV